MPQFSESIVEDAARAWLRSLAYTVLHGLEIVAKMLSAERSDPWSAVNQFTAKAAPL